MEYKEKWRKSTFSREIPALNTLKIIRNLRENLQGYRGLSVSNHLDLAELFLYNTAPIDTRSHILFKCTH